MSKTVKSKSAAEEMSFEAAMDKLESIVESMELDEAPLETLMAQFDEGSRLTKLCERKLAEAELKISQLEKKSSGALEESPMQTPEPNTTPDE